MFCLLTTFFWLLRFSARPGHLSEQSTTDDQRKQIQAHCEPQRPATPQRKASSKVCLTLFLNHFPLPYLPFKVYTCSSELGLTVTLNYINRVPCILTICNENTVYNVKCDNVLIDMNYLWASGC